MNLSFSEKIAYNSPTLFTVRWSRNARLALCVGWREMGAEEEDL